MTTTVPRITIGIPTHNRLHRFLPAALDSALGQDHPNLEVLVSDNASTDGTDDYVASLQDPRVRYVRHDPSLGAARNFNFCLAEATGSFFHLLHDDDLIDPGFISSCVQAIGDDLSVGVARTGIRIIDDTGAVLAVRENNAAGLSFEDFLRAWFSGRTVHYLPNTLFNTGHLRAIGGFRSKNDLFQDGDALVRLAAAHGRVDVKEPKASFRVHGDNLGGDPKRARAWAEDCRDLRDLIVELSDEGETESIRAAATEFLCRKSYRHASEIPETLGRLGLYVRIYAMFGYRHLPPPLETRRRHRTPRHPLSP